MISHMHDFHEQALKALERRGRLRQLSSRAGRDFSSNDYLGLSTSGELRAGVSEALARGAAIGAGGSRLLRGNDLEHEALETDAAAFFGAETALYFGSGFMANYAIFSTLPDRGDLIVHDALVHASVHDGMRASKAGSIAVPHNDVQAVDDQLLAYRERGNLGRAWIAIESLYSMDGDFAPLDELATVADRRGAILIIDEAHATGVYGPQGRGLGAHLEGRSDIISLHTCGKALGSSGGLVLAPEILRDFLINRCRPFIYATAPSPLMAAAVRAALLLCREQPERRQGLAARVALASREIETQTGYKASGSQIIPVIVGSDARATALASTMQARGFDIRAVRPPTVPEGTARVRISITMNVSESDITAMTGALAEELARLAP